MHPVWVHFPVAQEDRKVVIGKGGAMIKLLEKLFDCKSSLDDQGNMIVFGSNASVVEKTMEAVRGVILYVVFEHLCSRVCVRAFVFERLCSRAKQKYHSITL